MSADYNLPCLNLCSLVGRGVYFSVLVAGWVVVSSVGLIVLVS